MQSVSKSRKKSRLIFTSLSLLSDPILLLPHFEPLIHAEFYDFKRLQSNFTKQRSQPSTLLLGLAFSIYSGRFHLRCKSPNFNILATGFSEIDDLARLLHIFLIEF